MTMRESTARRLPRAGEAGTGAVLLLLLLLPL